MWCNFLKIRNMSSVAFMKVCKCIGLNEEKIIDSIFLAWFSFSHIFMNFRFIVF